MTAGFAAVLNTALTMSGRATAKTSGIVGDDLAINSKQLIGGAPDRKLPMVYAVGKGSLKNKFYYLIPTALLLSVTFPGLIMPALTLGGAYLTYEGIDKFLHKEKQPHEAVKAEGQVHDHMAWEKRHVKKAIKTDMILSAEITAVSLWTVAGAPFLIQALALGVAGVAMTVGVYGIVGSLITMGDIGAKLEKKKGVSLFSKAVRGIGRALKKTAPPIISTVGVIGTVAMFLVGGGMVLHGIPGGEHLVTGALNAVTTNPILQTIAMGAAETLTGVVAGFVAVPFMRVIEPAFEKTAEFVKKQWLKLFKKKPEVPEDVDAEDVQDALTPAEAAPTPLQKAPDVKAALNDAAPKAANDSKPAPVVPPAKAPEPPQKKLG